MLPAAVTLVFNLYGYNLLSQQSEFNRPQITIIVEKAKGSGTEAEDFSIFMSLPKLNSNYIAISGTDYWWIPKDWDINRDFFRYSDEYDENLYTQLPYFNKVDYNSVSSHLFLNSLDEAVLRPHDYLLNYSSEILEYIFAKKNNTFSLDRIVKRSMYNARDAALRLSENVQRGDAIIKDDLDRILNNIYIVGIKILSYKVDKQQNNTVNGNAYLFKLDYSEVVNNPNFWANCFKKNNTTACFNQSSIKISFLKKTSISAIWSDKRNMTMHSGFYQFIENIFKSFN
jgi:hypothetical protein